MRGSSPRMTRMEFVTAPALQRTASQELRAALRPGNGARSRVPGAVRHFMPLRRTGTVPNTEASWPGLTRPSIFFERILRRAMDARVKPAHDENGVRYGPGSAAHRFARATRCAASGERCQIPCPGRGAAFHAAPQNRDRTEHRSVMAGLDPAIHLLRRNLTTSDGCAGQARA